MGGALDAVKDTVVLFVEACRKSKIAFHIVLFSDDSVLLKVKPQNDREVFSILNSIDSFGKGGTQDVPATKKSLNKLKLSSANQRAAFVVTDGDGNKPEEQRRLVEQAEDEHGIPIYGIGVSSGMQSVITTYRRPVLVPDPASLPNKLRNTLLEFVRDAKKR
jgi:uncharacterized protein with von Willebrand factor type A (vWA) domain